MNLLNLYIQPFSGLPFWSLFLIAAIFSVIFNVVFKEPLLLNISFLSISMLVIRGATLDHNILPLVVVFFLSIMVFYHGKYLAQCSKSSSVSQVILISFILLVLGYCKYQVVHTYLSKFFFYILSLVKLSATHFDTRIIVLGISYVSFKLIHYIIDSANGRFKKYDSDILTFLNYIFFFPAYFSGPINRYHDFYEDVKSETKIKKSDISIGIMRIIDGLFKKIVLADNVAPYAISSLDLNTTANNPLLLIAGIYAYGFFIYFDFAGYSDLAIGAGRLLGIRLPENFNYPFVRRNIQQFWANWHMSLTNWLTDYLYWPMVKRFRKLSLLARRPVTISVGSIFITFVLCGIWHGDGLNYLLWGAYHGSGLAILNVYRNLIRKFAGLGLKKWIMKSKVSYAISTFITFNFVSWGFLLFACDMDKIRLVLKLLYQGLT